MSSPSPPVVSKYFARGAPGTDGTDGAFDDDDGLAARGCISRPNSFHPSFLECSRALHVAVESFVNEAAKKKAEYDAHEAALATILAHAEGTIESKTKELEKEKEQRREEKKTKKKKTTTMVGWYSVYQKVSARRRYHRKASHTRESDNTKGAFNPPLSLN